MPLSLLSFFSRKRNKSKIGVLYICTGKYAKFWNDFFKSAERHLCRKSEIHYFVFSDQVIDTNNNERIHFYYQPKLGWPYDTLKRFHIFLSQEAALQQMDYLYYYNANMSFQKNVTEEMILPNASQFPSELVGVIHPCHYNGKPEQLIYDRQLNSTAYMPIRSGIKYYQGCLSGGTTAAYLKMCHLLKSNIDTDEKRDIIALWHDESHINHYFCQNVPMPLNPGFAYPENMKIPFKKIIVQLDKAKVGGHEFLRN